jgi:hypothetical protein
MRQEISAKKYEKFARKMAFWIKKRKKRKKKKKKKKKKNGATKKKKKWVKIPARKTENWQKKL